MNRKILLYGDVNLNYRDGSGAWLEALAECLLRTGSEVHLLLKADIADPARKWGLEGLEGLTVHTPFDDQVSGMAAMKPRLATSRVVTLDRRHRFDVVISRGFDIAAALAVSGKFTGRLWPYLTEGPAFDFSPSEHYRTLLERVGTESRRIFVQTEEARSIVESLNGSMTGKTLLMNPIVPDIAYREKDHAPSSDSSLSMVYAGKFARLWKTLEMTNLPDQLTDHGLEATLSMIGDKFQNTGADHDWLTAMKAAAVAEDQRVTWHGGLPRTSVLDIVQRADVGLCWRDPELDSSPEISTKMLECSALGTPPVLNRTRMHEELLGSDYPLFVDRGDVLSTLRAAARSPELLARARRIAQDSVHSYSMAATADRFSQYFERAEADPASAGILRVQERRHRVVLAGHDFKFASELIESLRQRDDVELRIDKWRRLAAHDETASLEAARWADTVICEWAGPNAVFYAKNLPASTKLIVRFHGFEVRGKWLQDLDPRRVDAFVFVSDFYRRDVLSRLGWPEERSTVIYNTIDSVDLERPKLPGSQFHIGMAGYVPFLKRPDLAVDLLEVLLHTDKRYYLHIRGRVPWQYQWEWGKPAGQDAYRKFFQRIADDPLLRNHVIFEPFSPDMGNWFRRIGWMVSPSTRETFHLAPIEGMASAAPALVWDREGADEVFGADMVRSSTEELAELVLAHADRAQWASLGADAKQRAGRYDLMLARERWVHLLSLPRGEAPPLYGQSLLEDGAEPQNRAEALVALQRAFKTGGARAASDVFEAHHEWLEAEGTMVAGWRRLEGWSDGTSLPPAGLGPLYHPRNGIVLTVGKAAKRTWSDFVSIPVKAPKSVGKLDQDVLMAVDVFTRSAIRERAAAIVTSGSIGLVLAAQITARRLGIPWFVDSVSAPKLSGPVGTLMHALHDRLGRHARPFEDLPRAIATMPTRARNLVDSRHLRDLQVGLVADEFTSRTISATLPTVMLSRGGGTDQLEGLDAVIIESAWEGREHEWFHGVAYHGEEEAQDLWQLIAGSRARGIPVLFWNKEDPVHFRSFALAASRTDHVFTTDADRLPAYLQQSSQNLSASSLPFYAQPRLHNPLPSTRESSSTVAFAGSYYGSRYPKRSEELSTILEVAAEFGLTIYDRQKDRRDSPYQLPDELQQHSVGAVPYDQVLEVYKSHPVNINVNSVSNSPSMFSRRVVEIAASGSLVASGAGRGVREVLGGAFPVLTTAAEWREQLSLWLGDENTRLASAWEQMRTVLRSHRADQALTLMLRTAGLAVEPEFLPSYGWMIDDPALVDVAATQTWAPVIISSNETVAATARTRGLEVSTAVGELKWVTDSQATLPPSHFEDLLLATFFVSADVLSCSEDATVCTPLIDQGLGDLEAALWHSSLEGPDRGHHPFVWRVPFAGS